MENIDEQEMSARMDVALIGVGTILKLIGPEATEAMQAHAQKWRDHLLATDTPDEYLEEFDGTLQFVLSLPRP